MIELIATFLIIKSNAKSNCRIEILIIELLAEFYFLF